MTHEDGWRPEGWPYADEDGGYILAPALQSGDFVPGHGFVQYVDPYEYTIVFDDKKAVLNPDVFDSLEFMGVRRDPAKMQMIIHEDPEPFDE